LSPPRDKINNNILFNNTNSYNNTNNINKLCCDNKDEYDSCECEKELNTVKENVVSKEYFNKIKVIYYNFQIILLILLSLFMKMNGKILYLKLMR